MHPALSPVCVRLKRVWPVLLLALLLPVGCINTQQAAAGGPQPLSTLPDGWAAVTMGRNTILNRNAAGNWTAINIDDDPAIEYLLFFTYDNGQVGAIIYDQQAGSTGVVSASPVPAPNQPAGFYVPYQVEPSFWVRSETPDKVGFIAPPNTDPLTIIVQPVERYAADEPNAAGTASSDLPAGAPATNELVIYGGSSVISVIWWRSVFNGYGIAQMAAGNLQSDPLAAGAPLRPLQTVTGTTQLTGLLARSVLCRQVRFTRADAGEPPEVILPVYQNAVRYVESDGGIVFCFGAPPHPYYPEGVVLAFLHPPAAAAAAEGVPPVDPAQSYLWSKLDVAQRAALTAQVNLAGHTGEGAPGVVVLELRAPAGVPLPADYRTPAGGQLTTNVCAEIVSEDGSVFKRLLFDLVYEPVQTVGTTIMPERFVIANITDITTAVLNCALIIP